MKNLKPVFTTFANTMPSNLLFVRDWRYFAEHAYGIKSWENAAKKYAAQKGGALVLRGDGRLIVFTKLESGKIRRTTYQNGTWSFCSEEERQSIMTARIAELA